MYGALVDWPIFEPFTYHSTRVIVPSLSDAFAVRLTVVEGDTVVPGAGDVIATVGSALPATLGCTQPLGL